MNAIAATSPSGRRAHPESVHLLAHLAARDAGATGYSLFRREVSGRLVYAGGSGDHLPEIDVAAPPVPGTLIFPVHATDAESAILTFTFEEQSVAERAASSLGQVALAIEQVWRLWAEAAGLGGLAIRVGELEAELAEAKITNRIRGYLEQVPESGEDLIEAMMQHVQVVLRQFEAGSFLQKRRQVLELEMEERGLAEEAKVILQRRLGLSEEAAHRHLRMLSRKTRRPIRDIALEVVRHGHIAAGNRLPQQQARHGSILR